MIPKVFNQVIELGDGRTITLETGKLAKQADGSVVVRMGDTMLLATVVSARTANPEIDFSSSHSRLQRKICCRRTLSWRIYET